MPPAPVMGIVAGVRPQKGWVKSSYSYDLREVMDAFLDNQRMTLNSSESYADVALILQDGIIPAHGVLLEAASTFFRGCFESQGPYYFGAREVIMPDYNMRTMQKVIQLIYNQSVYCQHESETKEVEQAIKDLGIKLDQSLEIVQDTEEAEGKQVEGMAPSVDQCTKEMTMFKSNTSVPIKPTIILQETRTSKDPVADLEIDEEATARIQMENPRNSRAFGPPKPIYMVDIRSSSEDSETGSEMDKKTIMSPSSYIQKAKRCQKCKKDYPTADEATNCIESHNRKRCHICFRVYKDTMMLLQHFARAHCKGGSEGFGVCPWCEISITFKDLSNHIICSHLSGASGRRYPPPRKSNCRKRLVSKAPQLKTSHVAATKKTKLDVLKVGNLECTFTLERDNGKNYVFAVKKIRD